MVSRNVKLAKIGIGSNYPVRVESMLKVPLDDTLSCLEQLEDLEKAGCELARIAFPRMELEKNLTTVASSSRLPLMADIHFDPRLAIAAIDAGCPAIRINPGNVGSKKSIESIVDAARQNKTVIRIGANGGSINSRQLEDAEGDMAKALFLAVEEQLFILTRYDFHDIILSAKSTSINDTIRSNTMLSKKYPDYPFHIGITEAGPGLRGIVKSSCGLSILLKEGIGDTLRVSLTGDPCKEIETGYEILRATGLRDRGPEIISCPTCGRRRADVVSILGRVEHLFRYMPDGFKFAVMGCEVNGPREASSADLGMAGTPKGIAVFRNGKILGEYPAEEIPTILEELLKQIDSDQRH
jgi:(E)-4-hydroxy-3-methylbut-2-enyl-diphosphate synthase